MSRTLDGLCGVLRGILEPTVDRATGRLQLPSNSKPVGLLPPLLVEKVAMYGSPIMVFRVEFELGTPF